MRRRRCARRRRVAQGWVVSGAMRCTIKLDFERTRRIDRLLPLKGRYPLDVFGKLLAAVNLYVDFNGVDHGVLRLYCIGFRGIHRCLQFSKVHILEND